MEEKEEIVQQQCASQQEGGRFYNILSWVSMLSMLVCVSSSFPSIKMERLVHSGGAAEVVAAL